MNPMEPTRLQRLATYEIGLAVQLAKEDSKAADTMARSSRRRSR